MNILYFGNYSPSTTFSFKSPPKIENLDIFKLGDNKKGCYTVGCMDHFWSKYRASKHEKFYVGFLSMFDIVENFVDDFNKIFNPNFSVQILDKQPIFFCNDILPDNYFKQEYYSRDADSFFRKENSYVFEIQTKHTSEEKGILWYIQHHLLRLFSTEEYWNKKSLGFKYTNFNDVFMELAKKSLEDGVRGLGDTPIKAEQILLLNDDEFVEKLLYLSKTFSIKQTVFFNLARQYLCYNKNFLDFTKLELDANFIYPAFSYPYLGTKVNSMNFRRCYIDEGTVRILAFNTYIRYSIFLLEDIIFLKDMLSKDYLERVLKIYHQKYVRVTENEECLLKEISEYIGE